MNNPCSLAECQFLSWQHISTPPQFLAADIAHQHHTRIVDENPPGAAQWNVHEVVWAEMCEKRAMEPRRIKEFYGRKSWLKEPSVTLDEHGHQDYDESRYLASFFSPQREPRCGNSEQLVYSVRSERLLMEEMDYNILFRWCV